MNRTAHGALLLSMAILAVVLVGCGSRAAPPPVLAAAATPVSVPAKLVWSGRYSEHIQPILDQHCVTCHGSDRAENGLRLTSYQELMKGTRYGPVVVPGSPVFSTLIAVVEGKTDLSIRMPHRGRRLGEHDRRNLELWIEAGAPAD